jgi:hypothetical protein
VQAKIGLYSFAIDEKFNLPRARLPAGGHGWPLVPKILAHFVPYSALIAAFLPVTCCLLPVPYYWTAIAFTRTIYESRKKHSRLPIRILLCRRKDSRL